MKDLNYFTESPDETIDARVIDQNLAKTFMSNVFAYMFGGLLLTGVIALWFANSNLMAEYVINPETGKVMSPLYWIAMFGPLALVLGMSLGINKLSTPAMILLFIAYAGLNGIAFSTIFVRFDLAAIYKAFFSAALVFGTMSVVGYTTNTDLTKMGNILRIGLFALIGAIVINLFMQSGTMDYLISIGGVIIFTGLTAYDVQKLKRIGAGVDMQDASSKKLVTFGALTLYLDFINLFLFLLSLFSSRD